MLVYLPALSRAHDESRPLHTLINVFGFLDSEVFLTKSGDLGMVLRYQGKDAECMEPEALAALCARIGSAIRVFDDRFVVTQYWLKSPLPPLELRTYASRPLTEAAQHRARFLNARGVSLYSYETFLVVICKSCWRSPRLVDRLRQAISNPQAAFQNWRGGERRVLEIDKTIEESACLLRRTVGTFAEQVSEWISPQVLPQEEVHRFLRRLLNPDRAKADAVPFLGDTHVDYFVVDSELECYRDHLRLDNHYVKVLTLKVLPARTFADILRDLKKVRASVITVLEWSGQENATTIADIRSKQRHWHNTKTSILSQIGSDKPLEREMLFDTSREALVDELGACATAVEVEGMQVGTLTLTILLLTKTAAEAEVAAAEALKVFGIHEASLHEERYNALNAFIAALPGGFPFNLRQLFATTQNFVDLSFWFLPAEGSRENSFLGEEYLCEFETEEASLYFYNLHEGDIAHTLLVGPTGTGKSFFVNFLVVHAQKYLPYTVILDLGGSYQTLVQLLGGSSIQVRPDANPFSINPFVLPKTPENLEFLYSFFRVLAESGDYRLTDAEARDLFKAIEAIYVLKPEQRRLLTLANTVPRNVGIHLKRWTTGEQYGSWFDNAKDTVSFARTQYIDFEGMERLGVVLEALLFYLLHRANDIIYDSSLATTFKLFVIDELWRFTRHPVTRAYLIEGLKTWRKKNAGLLLSTQSVQDLSGEDTLQPVIESCPTKVLLSNPSLDQKVYGSLFGLTATEQERVRHLISKRQFLLKREGLAKVLNLNVDPRSYWLFTTNPFEAKRRDELIRESGLTRALEILSGESK